MNKVWIIFVCLLGYFSSLSAQDNIAEIITSMPDNIIYGLKPAEKELLISSKEDSTDVNVGSGLYIHLKRLDLSDNFISVQTSESGTTQIKLLPLINDSKIICVVKTVCGKFCDSQINFYTTKWLPLKSEKVLLPPITANWFLKDGIDENSQDFKHALAIMDVKPISLQLSPNNDNIEVKYNIEHYLSKDEYKKVEPFLINTTKTLEWDKNSFK